MVTPAVVLAELYRGPGRNQAVDCCLSRETGIRVRDTDRALARYVGGVLAAAGADSSDIVDAHIVATVVEAGGGVALTGDTDDLTRQRRPTRTSTWPHLTGRPPPGALPCLVQRS